MKGTLTLAWRDFKGLVTTPLFFGLSGLCALIWSVTYIRVLNNFAESSLKAAYQASNQAGGPGAGLSLHFQVFWPHIQAVNFLLLLIIPALTMRLFAEEKKTRSFDLLLTSPITATQITLGKFLAGFGVSTIFILIASLYPLSTAFLTDIQWGQLFSSIIGLWLLTGAYVAVGIFASSLTESVVLAVVMAFIFNVGLWFIGAGADVAEGEFLKGLFEHLSIGQHFVSFLKGSIKTAAIIFFISVISLNCFLTQRVVESSRWR